jgi:predicted P-loop ATPase
MGIVCRLDMFREVVLIDYAGEVYELQSIVGDLTDNTLLMIRNKFNLQYEFEPDEKDIYDAVMTIALDHCFDPIKDMLTEAEGKWDRKARLDKWAVTYLGCKDTALTRAVGRKTLIAAARRARMPGCKFDNIPTLEGEEGILKSMVSRVFAGDEFFSDQNILGARDKEVQEQLAGIWMHENAELSGMKKADVEHVKAFARRQVDRARPAYGRVTKKVPRRSIEWGSTNNDVYLQSDTGNRSFWPLKCGVIDIESLRRDRLQLLGEAAHYESKGESIVLDEALWPDAAIEQEKRRVQHPWENILDNIPKEVSVYDKEHRWMEEVTIIHTEPELLGKVLQKVASSDLLEHVLRVPIGQQQRHHSMTLASVMKKLKWHRPDGQKITRTDGVRVVGYQREVEPEPVNPFTRGT